VAFARSPIAVFIAVYLALPDPACLAWPSPTFDAGVREKKQSVGAVIRHHHPHKSAE
jgi:hypothetical protein